MASRVSAPCSAEQDREGAAGFARIERRTHWRNRYQSPFHRPKPSARYASSSNQLLVMRAVLIEPSRGTHGDHHPHDGASSGRSAFADLRVPWMVSRSMLGRRARGAPGTLHHIEWPYPASTEGAHLFSAWAARCPEHRSGGRSVSVRWSGTSYRSSRSRRMFERRGVPTGRVAGQMRTRRGGWSHRGQKSIQSRTEEEA